MLIGRDQEKAARIALYPVAYNIEESGPAEIAQKVLKALDAGDKTAALKAFEPTEKKAEDKKKA